MNINIKVLEKNCTKCKIFKSLDNFSKYKEGLKPACKQCYSLEEKERRILKGCTNRIDRSTETENTKICTKCLQLKSKSKFKHPTECVECIKIRNRQYAEARNIIPKFIPIVNENSKQCGHCKEVKLLNEYSNSKKGRLGKSTYCKKCSSIYQMSKKTKEERKINTQKYRDNNREWWRFLHRINQFNRKNKVKNASDGSTTKEFMIKLYETEKCYYCKNIIKRENRTCEHKQPLNKGGVHGINNLVMSCISCNSSKQDKTEEEFINYLNKIKENE